MTSPATHAPTIPFMPFHNPMRFLSGDLAAHGYDVHSAALDSSRIDIRIEWNGSGAHLGRFEVKTGDFDWGLCRNLATDDHANDLIYPCSRVTAGALEVRFSRGPDHPTVGFKARALPIAWKDGKQPQQDVNDSYTAIRWLDYEYAGAAGDVNAPDLWQASTIGNNGVQVLSLHLDTARDYEVWVNLQSPIDPSQWLPLDPIVRPGESRPGQETSK